MMTIKNAFSIVILLTLIISSACWKKQHHEIIAPLTPVYNLSGRAICSLTNEPLKEVNIKITGTVKYNVEDTVRNICFEQMTDKDGLFAFSEVPGGYGYYLMAEKDGYQVYSHPYTVYYSDGDIGDIILGKWLTEKASVSYDDVQITGITFKDNSIWIADSLNKCIAELNNDLTTKKYITFNKITPLGLDWDGQSFWTSNALNDSLYSFQLDEYYYVSYGNAYLRPVNFYHEDQIIDIIDLDSSDDQIWACSPQIPIKYFRFDPANPEIITYFNTPLNKFHPVGIAVADTIVYIACEYSSEALIYLLNKQNNILGYAVIPAEAGLLTWDGNHIWITKENSISKYSF